MKYDEEYKFEKLMNYIDTKLTGPDVKYRKIDLAAFVAGYLQDIIKMNGFESVIQPIRQKVLNLSFLVHLVCRFEDFEKVYGEHRLLQDDLTSSNISWDDEQYFRQWEVDIINREFEDEADVDADDAIENLVETEMKTENESDEEIPEVRKKRKRKVKVKNEDEGEDDSILIGIKPRKKRGPYKKKDPSQKKAKIRMDPGKILITCEDCKFETVSKKKYMEHMFERHEQNLCIECGTKFDKFEVYYIHLEAHEATFVCDQCSAQFRTDLRLRNHQKIFHGLQKESKKKEEVCNICGLMFKNMKAHMQAKHTDESKLFRCEQCDYKSPNRNEVKRHFTAIHTNDNVTKCPFCKKPVKALKRHLLRSKCDIPESERKTIEVSCDICQKTFGSVEYLKNHKRKVHTDNQYQCSICNFQSKYIENLKQHVRTVHEKKPLRETCPHCDKVCTSIEWHIKNFHSDLPLTTVNKMYVPDIPINMPTLTTTADHTMVPQAAFLDSSTA